MKLVVTTTYKARHAEHERARLVADRCGVEVVRRPKQFDELLENHLVYVVGKARDELRTRDARLAVNPGLLRTRLHVGRDHPLIRAVAPDGRATHLVDGTLGLAGDALHLAGALACAVTGIEISPALFCLNEEGLVRLATDPKTQVAEAAGRVTPRLGDCAEVMGAMAPDSADAVLLAPMYEQPDSAAPGFELLRALAVHRPLGRDQIDAALRIAPRLVVKWPSGAEAPDALPARTERIEGRSVDYWVLTREG